MDKVKNARAGKEDLVKAFKSTAKTQKKVAEIIIKEGFAVLGAHNGDITFLRDDGTLDILAHQGYPKNFIKRWPRIPQDTPLLTKHVTETKKPFFVKNIKTLDAKYKVARAFITTSGAYSAALLPLKIKHDILGILQFTFRSPQKFTRDERIFMTTLANQCAQAFERVIAQENLRESVKKLEALDQRKNDFINMAAHELKNPVTTIKAYCQILLKRLQDTKDRKNVYFLSNVNTQSDKLTALIEDFLNISKIETGKLTLNKIEVDLDLLIQKTVVDFQYTTQTHQIQRIEEVKRPVLVDADRIGQVLINLLTNAIKYSPKADKIIVHSSVRGDSVIVSVQDFGVGISRNEQKEIFGKYFRVSEKGEQSGKGFGLGLYITAEIIKRHGGRIWVESKKGKGSTFSFSLPLAGKTNPQ